MTSQGTAYYRECIFREYLTGETKVKDSMYCLGAYVYYYGQARG